MLMKITAYEACVMYTRSCVHRVSNTSNRFIRSHANPTEFMFAFTTCYKSVDYFFNLDSRSCSTYMSCGRNHYSSRYWHRIVSQDIFWSFFQWFSLSVLLHHVSCAHFFCNRNLGMFPLHAMVPHGEYIA